MGKTAQTTLEILLIGTHAWRTEMFFVVYMICHGGSDQKGLVVGFVRTFNLERDESHLLDNRTICLPSINPLLGSC